MHIFFFIRPTCVFPDFPAFFVGYPPSVLVKNGYFPLHVHKFPFINTSCFFGDFPAFFVGGPPISCSEKTLTFLLHVRILPFIHTSSVLRDFPAFFIGDPYQLTVVKKPLLFPFMCTFSPSYAQVAFFVIFQLFFGRGPPISFSQNPFFFSFMCTYSFS